MRRSTALVFVVLGAALAGFVFSSAAVQLRDDDAPAEPSVRAGPQRATLYWREPFETSGGQLVFEVDRIEVLKNGWRASIRMTNRTSVSYAIGDRQATIDRAFGLMLFETGDLTELESGNREGTLPTTREAEVYKPSLPMILEPGSSWSGTISAPGPLVAGSWARVVFGTLLPVGATDDEPGSQVVWITDHAYRLKR
jgi:hypothetical protein